MELNKWLEREGKYQSERKIDWERERERKKEIGRERESVCVIFFCVYVNEREREYECDRKMTMQKLK